MNTKRHLIAIAGGTSSGKTTLSLGIQKKLGSKCVGLTEDWYYIESELSGKIELEGGNFDHPSAIEYPLLLNHIKKLLDGRTIYAPRYSKRTHTRLKSTKKISASDFIVVDGLFTLFDSNILGMASVKVFLDIPSDIRLLRRIQKDIMYGLTVSEICDYYLNTARPMHEAFVEPSMKNANILVTYEREFQKVIEASSEKTFITYEKQYDRLIPKIVEFIDSRIHS